jgi:methionine-gamma-lyase
MIIPGMESNEKWGFSTQCLHGYENNTANESHILPIYPSSSFVFETLEDSIDVFTGQKSGHVYSRYGNPTVEAVASKIASLEGYGSPGGYWGLLTSSGMSAIYVVLRTLLKPGDALLCPHQLYGGTTELLQKVFQPMGVSLIQTDFSQPEQIERQLESVGNIRAMYLETPSNPTLQCFDLLSITALAARYGVKTVVDNTFPTPFHQQPLLLGADYVIHSTTKYLNGHGNGIAGVLVGKGGNEERYPFWQNVKLMGVNCSPFEAWLVYNGLKTLALRMSRHSENAQRLATFLETHACVEKVHYPGLVSHEGHIVANRQMKLGFGGMLSFTIKGGTSEHVAKCMNSLQLATQAPTLGDVDTLVMHPFTSSHLKVSNEQKQIEGVTENLIRVSVGIEDIHDLIADFDRALSMSNGVKQSS